MLRILLASLVIAWAAPTARAQEVLPPDPDIEATISSQMEAFRAGDVPEAWSYASPTIQDLFGSQDNFARMVQEGYPMVWNPGAVDFIDLNALGSAIVQRVQVIDAQGAAHYLGYLMVETEEGWRIGGVQVLRAPDVAA